MNTHCTHCGTPLTTDQKFCSHCGHPISSIQQNSSSTTSSSSFIAAVNKIFSSKKTALSFLLFIAMLISSLFLYISDLTASWVIDAACIKAKSEIYETHGVVPSVSGELIYKNDYDHIVVVTFGFPDLDLKQVGSHACYMHGRGKGTYVLHGMTNQLPYDYDYDSHLEELKALWALE